MPHSSGPSLLPIERPRCPKCQQRMHLARIMPGPKGFDIRTFECTKCHQLLTVKVAIDSVGSDVAIGWLQGELASKDGGRA